MGAPRSAGAAWNVALVLCVVRWQLRREPAARRDDLRPRLLRVVRAGAIGSARSRYADPGEPGVALHRDSSGFGTVLAAEQRLDVRYPRRRRTHRVRVAALADCGPCCGFGLLVLSPRLAGEVRPLTSRNRCA